MTIAILYSRFSSKKQVHGDSIRRQSAKAEEYCSRHGLVLSDLNFADLGISGWQSKKREGLESLIESIESGKVPKGSFILVEAADRLTRQGYRHVIDLVGRLVKTGCTFVTLDDGLTYHQGNIDSFGNAIKLLLSADLAKDESDRKSMRIREVKTQKRKERVIQGSQPFWITVKNGKPELNEFAKLARRIVDLRLKGRSASGIAKMLNEEGIESPKGKAWYSAPIRKMLENTILYGAKTYWEKRDGEFKPVETVSGLYPAICTFEEFSKITTQQSAPKGRKQVGPFSSLLKCSCGRGITISRVNHEGTYRACSGKLVKACDVGGYYRDTDSFILRVLREVKVARVVGSIVGQVEDTELKIQELEQQLESLQEMRKQNRGKAAVLQMLLEDIQATSEELAELKNKPKPINDDVDLLRIVDVSDVAEQNALFRGVIDRIECSKPASDTARYRVHFKNGFIVSFQVQHSRKAGLSVMMLGDGQAIINADAKDDLQPWELGQEEE